ncbi:TMhelix containing protein [Vibrio phage 1.044.O._10N.261.51.B8]|uniref:TMhelix containing protein n=2 Tax=Autolykiviridae TaxID=2184034 RepID=A0A2I7QR85_9VIRU|nr:TMhelix containing protein [Vibrio phage 1.044.O._10N.261.51.B8]AUR83896.1 TMhelix containing protein [Vibrio phage 1.043.O._10N.261.52.C7]AUR83917.1 TMhelix containing protein [Vibrio phage 1.044.O._10N.261.51.B8]
MNIDSNPFENFFATTTPNQQQTGIWDSIIGAGSEIIGSLPDVVDGVIGNALNGKEQEKVDSNQNITSSDPSVSGDANKPSVMVDNTGKYILYGFGGLITLVVVAKLIK